MMPPAFMPSFWELLIILAIVLVFFGGGKLPQIGRDFGKMIKNFGDSVKGKDAIDVTPKKPDEKIDSAGQSDSSDKENSH